MEKVSIIIPTYKRHTDLLKRAVDSLIGQTYPNIEIILVDDNAGETLAGYREEVESFVEALACSRLVYLQNRENLGGSGARNEGLKAATGEYVTFLDDDDRYLPDKVKRQLSFMLENDLDMCFTDLRIHNGADKLSDYREYSRLEAFDQESLMKYHLTRQIAGTNTFMYRTETLKAIGGFVKVDMGQEYYLMYHTIQYGCKIGYLKGSDVILYRQGQDCISSGPNKIKGQKALYEFKKQNFGVLSASERRFVRFRHHVVMAVAYKRNHSYLKMLGEVVAAFFCAPIRAFEEFFGFFRRRRENQGMEESV